MWQHRPADGLSPARPWTWEDVRIKPCCCHAGRDSENGPSPEKREETLVARAPAGGQTEAGAISAAGRSASPPRGRFLIEGGSRAEEAGVRGGPVFLDAGTSQQRSDPAPSPLRPTHVAPFSSHQLSPRPRVTGRPPLYLHTYPPTSVCFRQNAEMFPKGTTVGRQ